MELEETYTNTYTCGIVCMIQRPQQTMKITAIKKKKANLHSVMTNTKGISKHTISLKRYRNFNKNMIPVRVLTGSGYHATLCALGPGRHLLSVTELQPLLSKPASSSQI